MNFFIHIFSKLLGIPSFESAIDLTESDFEELDSMATGQSGASKVLRAATPARQNRQRKAA